MLLQYCWVCLICQIYITIWQRIVMASSPPTITHHCLIFMREWALRYPPRATSSLTLPGHLLAPPALPSLGDCFPCGSVDLGKYFLYSSALSRRARWRTSLTMLLGGAGESSFGIGYFANEDDASDFQQKEKKRERSVTSMHRGIRKMDRWRLSLRKNRCGIVFTSKIFTLTKMWSYRRHFVTISASHTNNILSWCSSFSRMSCLIDGVGISLTTRRCPRLSCLSLVHCVILVVGGPLMTVKSPMQLTRRSVVVFLMFLYDLEVQSFTKNGS